VADPALHADTDRNAFARNELHTKNNIDIAKI